MQRCFNDSVDIGILYWRYVPGNDLNFINTLTFPIVCWQAYSYMRGLCWCVWAHVLSAKLWSTTQTQRKTPLRAVHQLTFYGGLEIHKYIWLCWVRNMCYNALVGMYVAMNNVYTHVFTWWGKVFFCIFSFVKLLKRFCRTLLGTATRSTRHWPHILG